ncbi:MAG: hypothetical protein KAI47_15240, partial [Deltaproteobacteria bacterium]|nr:hypothetical protein [Deltaproteobacteria bacterium]
FYLLYNKMYWYLDHAGLGQKVKIVGYDNGPTSPGDPMKGIGDTLAAWSGGRRVDEYVGAISFHSYRAAARKTCDAARLQIDLHNYDGQREEVIVAEIGDSTGDHSSVASKVANAVDSAKKVVSYANAGAAAIVKWGYNNLGNGFDATVKSGATIVPQNFNVMALFASSIPRKSVGRKIWKTDVVSQGGYFDGVAVSYWMNGKKKVVLWLVNDDAKPKLVTITLKGLSQNVSFRKTLIDFNDASCPILSGGAYAVGGASPTLTDSVPARGAVVYVAE